MGYSTTLATAFATIILITGISIMVFTNLSSIEAYTDAVSESTDRSKAVLGEVVELGRVSQLGDGDFAANVTNTGGTCISIDDFSNIDILLTYSNNSCTVKQWLPWDQDAGSGHYWLVNRTFFNGERGEVVSPLRYDGSYSGFWDPMETMEILLHCEGSVQEFLYLEFYTPLGVKASRKNGLDYDTGQAVISSGETEVVIEHRLSDDPSNIQVTPNVELRNGTVWWVDNATTDSFTVHISETHSYNASFYWWVIS